MDCSTTYLPFESTGYFSKIVEAYLQQHENIRPFYLHEPNWQGVETSMLSRDRHPVNREVLTEALLQQYDGQENTEAVFRNIALLKDSATYTITTAHQPNLFTGPMYFIYKILHVIKLAESFSAKYPDKKFVPVFYMGSEDADLDELGFVNIDGARWSWDTKQSGAVGRMNIDKQLLSLIESIAGQIGVLPNGNEWAQLLRNNYATGKTIQEATLSIVHALFGHYGLVVLIPDQASLKKLFVPVMAKELTEQFSHKAVSATIQSLEQYYKVQAAGRPLNLFYLIDDKRERIEKEGNVYTVPSLNLQFTEVTILQELNEHPERFSPNVILRGAFQETILPNIVFVGGGGELAYWLELKTVFEKAGVAYPMLLLRNSFSISSAKLVQKQLTLQLTDADLFLPEHQLISQYVEKHSEYQLNLDKEKAALQAYYDQLNKLATQIDPSLRDHVTALSHQSLKKITELEKKMKRAEKRNFSTAAHQIQTIKQALFPGNSLQERQENLASFYARYGRSVIDMIYKASGDINPAFGLIKIQS